MVAVAWPVSPMFSYSAATMEEGALLAGAEAVLAGKSPHADFEHLYGPADVWFVAGAFGLLGESVVVERVVGLAYRLLLLGSLLRITHRWGWGLATGATLLAWLIIAPFGLIAYSWIGGIAFATASLALALNSDRGPETARSGLWLARQWRWVGSGLFAGIALLFRADLIVALAAGIGVVLWSCRQHWRPFVASLSFGVATYLVHLIRVGPIRLFEAMFVDPVIRLRAGRSLPLPPSTTEVAEFFARLDHYLRGPETLPLLDLPAQLAVLFWIVLVGSVAAVWLAWRSCDRRLLAFVLFVVAALPQMLQRPGPNHVAFVGMLVLPALAVAIAHKLRWRHISGLIPAGLLCLTLLAAPHFVGRAAARALWSPPDTVQVEAHGRVLPVGDEQVRDGINSILDALDLHAEPGDTVFVGPEDLSRTNYSETYLYFLMPDYVPASYYLQMNPGLANRTGSMLADGIASADWLILTDRFDGWAEPNASTVNGDPRANAIVDEQFCTIKEVAERTLYGQCNMLDS